MSLRSDKRVTALFITLAAISGIALMVERFTARQSGPVESAAAPEPVPSVAGAPPSETPAAAEPDEALRPLQGGGLSPAGQETILQPAPDPATDPQGYALWQLRQEVHLRFQQGVAMLQQRRYDYAVAAFSRVVELAPDLSDAHINLGFSYLGVDESDAAWDHFQYASDLSPTQANAYYGMAMVAERKGDLRLAMSGMRTYLHMSNKETAPEAFVQRARSALWEWEAKLGEGPWGPTRGIPPGFTEEEMKRDGTGVGVLGMKRGETMQQALARRKAASLAGGVSPAGGASLTGGASPAGVPTGDASPAGVRPIAEENPHAGNGLAFSAPNTMQTPGVFSLPGGFDPALHNALARGMLSPTGGFDPAWHDALARRAATPTGSASPSPMGGAHALTPSGG